MFRRAFPGSLLLPAASAVVITLAFGFSFIATSRSLLAQTSSAASQANNSATRRTLVVLGTDLKDKTIRFGDELVVLITLQNQATKPIRIPPNALTLKNQNVTRGSSWSSGLDESPLVRTDNSANEFTLQPGESAALTASSFELGSYSMGSMKAEFVIETEDEDLRRELGKPEPFTLEYYVAPSRLMTAAWAARTAEEQKQLQPQIRELLILASKREEESHGFYVSDSLRHLGCHTLSLLESAMRDSDPIVRAQALLALLTIRGGAEQLNSFLIELNAENEGRTWAASVERCQENRELEEKEQVRLGLSGLGDKDARVRTAAISVLTNRAAIEANLRRSLAADPPGRQPMDARTKQIYDSIGLVDPALPLIKKLAADADPGVRAEAQKFLSNFASQQAVAGDVAASLADPDAGVRIQALQALKKSHEAPPMATIEKAFASTKGEVARGLVELIYEREDSQMATRLTPGFQERSSAERLKILTAIAGHTDDAALKLVGLGLKDADTAVQRAALMRLLAFPTQKSLSLIKTNLAAPSPDLRQLSVDVQKELESRAIFPSLASGHSSLRESTFPAIEGTGPTVSPDGKLVAYVETGWGRPGGSGGMGRSNLLSITHVIRSDGTSDRIVSDMFMVGWMSDSRRLASARDGFAAIVNLNGKQVLEFGDRLIKPDTGAGIGDDEVWPNGDMRHQLGVRQPHSKRFQGDESREAMFSFDYGEDAAFSPDGKWFGPRRVGDQWQFVDADGNKREMKAPGRETIWGSQAVWAADGEHVVVVPVVASGSFGGDNVVEPSKAFVIDMSGPTIAAVIDVDQVWSMGGWNYRKGRWNPWSKDGKRLAFIRNGQAWISAPDGGSAMQVTFDASNKVFPTFSPDGTKIAYIAWQFDNREHYTRLGPTDIWVVDIKTGLAVRITRADSGRIEGLDWLDNGTIIFDRVGPDDKHSRLRTVSLR